MTTFAQQVVAKAPTLVYSLHRKLSYLPLLGVAYALANILLIIILTRHLPIADASPDVNGGSLLHQLGQIRWMILLGCFFTFPAWFLLTLFSALPRNRQYFDWRSAVAYLVGIGLYVLLLSPTNLRYWFFD